MAKSLTVDGQTYLYPENRDEAGWGEEATSWAEAVTTVLGNINGVGDILIQSFTLTNNVSSPASITNFFFDPLSVRSAVIEYSVYRNSNTLEYSEAGTMYLTYKTVAGTWELSRVGVGSSGVQFSITNAGQVQYTSDDMGTGHSGVVKFRARAFQI